jgi:hypothetical protein
MTWSIHNYTLQLESVVKYPTLCRKYPILGIFLCWVPNGTRREIPTELVVLNDIRCWPIAPPANASNHYFRSFGHLKNSCLATHPPIEYWRAFIYQERHLREPWRLGGLGEGHRSTSTQTFPRCWVVYVLAQLLAWFHQQALDWTPLIHSSHVINTSSCGQQKTRILPYPLYPS